MSPYSLYKDAFIVWTTLVNLSENCFPLSVFLDYIVIQKIMLIPLRIPIPWIPKNNSIASKNGSFFQGTHLSIYMSLKFIKNTVNGNGFSLSLYIIISIVVISLIKFAPTCTFDNNTFYAKAMTQKSFIIIFDIRNLMSMK